MTVSSPVAHATIAAMVSANAAAIERTGEYAANDLRGRRNWDIESLLAPEHKLDWFVVSLPTMVQPPDKKSSARKNAAEILSERKFDCERLPWNDWAADGLETQWNRQYRNAVS